MHGDRQRQRDARPRAGRPPSCRCSRPDASARRGVSASRHASGMPGKPPPEPRSTQSLASGASAKSCSELATWRVQISGSVEGAIEVGGLLPGRAADRRSGRAALPFHVKRESAAAHARGPRRVRSCPRHACAARRPFRRTCAASSVSAAGVMPSSRPAWPMVRGRAAVSFCARLVGEAGHRRIVEVVRQREGFVAAIGGDVGRLAREIDVVFRVGLELLGDRRRRGRRAAARSGASVSSEISG